MFSFAVKPVTLVLTSLNGICKPEVEQYLKPKVLITYQWKQISTRSQWLYLFWGASFSLVYMPTLLGVSFTNKFQDVGPMSKIVITL